MAVKFTPHAQHLEGIDDANDELFYFIERNDLSGFQRNIDVLKIRPNLDPYSRRALEIKYSRTLYMIVKHGRHNFFDFLLANVSITPCVPRDMDVLRLAIHKEDVPLIEGLLPFFPDPATLTKPDPTHSALRLRKADQATVTGAFVTPVATTLRPWDPETLVLTELPACKQAAALHSFSTCNGKLDVPELDATVFSPRLTHNATAPLSTSLSSATLATTMHPLADEPCDPLLVPGLAPDWLRESVALTASTAQGPLEVFACTVAQARAMLRVDLARAHARTFTEAREHNTHITANTAAAGVIASASALAHSDSGDSKAVDSDSCLVGACTSAFTSLSLAATQSARDRRQQHAEDVENGLYPPAEEYNDTAAGLRVPHHSPHSHQHAAASAASSPHLLTSATASASLADTDSALPGTASSNAPIELAGFPFGSVPFLAVALPVAPQRRTPTPPHLIGSRDAVNGSVGVNTEMGAGMGASWDDLTSARAYTIKTPNAVGPTTASWLALPLPSYASSSSSTSVPLHTPFTLTRQHTQPLLDALRPAPPSPSSLCPVSVATTVSLLAAGVVHAILARHGYTTVRRDASLAEERAVHLYNHKRSAMAAVRARKREARAAGQDAAPRGVKPWKGNRGVVRVGNDVVYDFCADPHFWCGLPGTERPRRSVDAGYDGAGACQMCDDDSSSESESRSDSSSQGEEEYDKYGDEDEDEEEEVVVRVLGMTEDAMPPRRTDTDDAHNGNTRGDAVDDDGTVQSAAAADDGSNADSTDANANAHTISVRYSHRRARASNRAHGTSRHRDEELIHVLGPDTALPSPSAAKTHTRNLTQAAQEGRARALALAASTSSLALLHAEAGAAASAGVVEGVDAPTDIFGTTSTRLPFPHAPRPLHAVPTVPSLLPQPSPTGPGPHPSLSPHPHRPLVGLPPVRRASGGPTARYPVPPHFRVSVERVCEDACAVITATVARARLVHKAAYRFASGNATCTNAVTTATQTFPTAATHASGISNGAGRAGASVKSHSLAASTASTGSCHYVAGTVPECLSAAALAGMGRIAAKAPSASTSTSSSSAVSASAHKRHSSDRSSSCSLPFSSFVLPLSPSLHTHTPLPSSPSSPSLAPVALAPPGSLTDALLSQSALVRVLASTLGCATAEALATSVFSLAANRRWLTHISYTPAPSATLSTSLPSIARPSRTNHSLNSSHIAVYAPQPSHTRASLPVSHVQYHYPTPLPTPPPPAPPAPTTVAYLSFPRFLHCLTLAQLWSVLASIIAAAAIHETALTFIAKTGLINSRFRPARCSPFPSHASPRAHPHAYGLPLLLSAILSVRLSAPALTRWLAPLMGRAQAATLTQSVLAAARSARVLCGVKEVSSQTIPTLRWVLAAVVTDLALSSAPTACEGHALTLAHSTYSHTANPAATVKACAVAGTSAAVLMQVAPVADALPGALPHLNRTRAVARSAYASSNVPTTASASAAPAPMPASGSAYEGFSPPPPSFACPTQPPAVFPLVYSYVNRLVAKFPHVFPVSPPPTPTSATSIPASASTSASTPATVTFSSQLVSSSSSATSLPACLLSAITALLRPSPQVPSLSDLCPTARAHPLLAHAFASRALACLRARGGRCIYGNSPAADGAGRKACGSAPICSRCGLCAVTQQQLLFLLRALLLALPDRTHAPIMCPHHDAHTHATHSARNAVESADECRGGMPWRSLDREEMALLETLQRLVHEQGGPRT